MKNVLVTIPVSESHRERMNAIARDCSIRYVPGAQVTEEQVAEASVIIGNVPARFIRASEKLELLQLESAGADPYLPDGVLAKSTVLCNATGAYTRTVSEHAVALTMDLMKKLYLYRDAQRSSRWIDFGTAMSPAGATVLVVGLGEIGLQYARIMKAMGATVIGVKRRTGECPEGIDELVLTEEVDAVLPRADVIFSILPNTKQTVHFYTEERFRRMKDSAVFINCGRGNAVEGSVLLKALQEGQIAAAAIDVTESEPLPAEDPLWQQENLVITPHVAGTYHIPYTLERIVDIACENLEHWVKGEPFCNTVDMETGYRR